jgi:hypothetical protein
MLRRIALAVIGLLLVATTAWALEANGVLKQIDADGSRIVVFANGADRNLKIDPAARFLDEKGQPLAEGLKSSQFKAEAAVTITVEMGNGGPILKALQLGTRPVGTAGGGRPSAGGRPNNSGPPQTGTTSVGLKPLTEMTAGCMATVRTRLLRPIWRARKKRRPGSSRSMRRVSLRRRGQLPSCRSACRTPRKSFPNSSKLPMPTRRSQAS